MLRMFLLLMHLLYRILLHHHRRSPRFLPLRKIFRLLYHYRSLLLGWGLGSPWSCYYSSLDWSPERYFSTTALHTTTEPKGFKSTMKHPNWLAAMEDGISYLQKNCTWTLVPWPSTTTVIGSKWVFILNSKVTKLFSLKVGFVAQGFTQIPGFDYSLTFCSVVKATIVHLILPLVVLNGWQLH